MVVKEVMTSEPVTADAGAKISDVISALFELDVRHLPVVDGSELIGIVSDRDLRAFMAPALIELENPGAIARY